MRIAAWVRPFRSWFQSSSSPKTGCKVLGVLIPRVVVPVSILIQPEDRMQESGLGGFGQSQLCFNPHPARRPDASPVDMQQLRSGQPRFNPHPARRPDASGVPGRSPIDWAFQSSSSPKTGCKGGFVVIGEPHLNQFQSSSSPKTGCKRRGAGTAGGCRTCFNPHPARRPDASGAGREQPAVAVLVSILIQPEDRMQAARGGNSRRLPYLFQSSSSPKTGCKRRGAGTAGGCRTCFNPHPARRPDASLPGLSV